MKTSPSLKVARYISYIPVEFISVTNVKMSQAFRHEQITIASVFGLKKGLTAT